MASDGAVRIKILGDDSNFRQVINGTETSLRSLSGLVAKLGLTVSVGKVVADAVKNTNALEDSLAKASTLFGNVDVNVTSLSDKIKELSNITGMTASSIGESLYNALSAGVEVTEDMGTAMEFMEATSKLAVAGFTDVDNSVQAVAKVWNAYGKDVISVDEISKVLIQTQNLGITTVDQLGSALATVTPVASAFGLSFEQVGASLAVMTKAGTDTATATTQLRSVLNALGQSDTNASKALKEASKQTLGQAKSFQELNAEGYTLQEILKMMDTYAKSTGVSLMDLFGEVRAGTGALQLVSDATATYETFLESMSSDADIVGEAYDKVMGTRSKQWSLLGSRLRNLTIEITESEGTQRLLDDVYALADKIVSKFEEWSPAIQRGINTVYVSSGILFGYLEDNLEKLPLILIGAFSGINLAKTLLSCLGLGLGEAGLPVLSIAIEIAKTMNGEQSWQETGEKLITALAIGLGIGAFTGSPKIGMLAFTISLSLELNSKSFRKALDSLGMYVASLYDSIQGFLRGDSNYSANQDAFKVAMIRRDVPSAIKLSDEQILQGSKIADTLGEEYVEYFSAFIEEMDRTAKESCEKVIAEIEAGDMTSTTDVMKATVAMAYKNISDSDALKTIKEAMYSSTDYNGRELSNQQGHRIAKYILDGLRNGMYSEDPAKISADAMARLIDGAEEELDINSPSKVFEEIGYYITKGLENGMTGSELEVAKQKLDEAFFEMGEDISEALASGFDENGNAYTITEAIQDMVEGTKVYNSLGRSLSSATPIESSSSGSSGSTTSELDPLSSELSTDPDPSWLEKAWSKLGEQIEDVEKTGFDAIEEISSALSDLTSSIGEYYSTIYEQQATALEEAKENAKDNGDLTVEEEKEMDAQINALRKKQFESEKRTNIATASMDGAMAILKIWKEWAGTPYAVVLTALAGATLATQLATISSQQYSGYENGGLIGGHGITGDKQQIWANAGELILNRAQQNAIAHQLNDSNTTVIRVDFSGNVFGDQQTIAEYVYDAIKTAQNQGVIREW